MAFVYIYGKYFNLWLKENKSVLMYSLATTSGTSIDSIENLIEKS
jgi:hypothetical protein